MKNQIINEPTVGSNKAECIPSILGIQGKIVRRSMGPLASPAWGNYCRKSSKYSGIVSRDSICSTSSLRREVPTTKAPHRMAATSSC